MGNRNQLYNDSEEAFRVASSGQQAALWTAIPAIVTKVNRAEMTVECQPTVKGRITDENGAVISVNLPVLINVPVCFPKAGGFILTLPIQIDDEVLVIFASRCIDAWWQSGGVGEPLDDRMHDLSDGFCIPGPTSQVNLVSGISSTGAQLRNAAGTTYIEIAADGKIKLVSPSDIDVTGNLKVTGSIQATGEVTGSGIALSTHVHSGVSTGSGDSGPPVP